MFLMYSERKKVIDSFLLQLYIEIICLTLLTAHAMTLGYSKSKEILNVIKTGTAKPMDAEINDH